MSSFDIGSKTESSSNTTNSKPLSEQVDYSSTFLDSTGEGVDSKKFLSALDEFGRDDKKRIQEGLTRVLVEEVDGIKQEIPVQDITQVDAELMLSKLNRLAPSVCPEKFHNYNIERPFVVSVFNVLRIMPITLARLSNGTDTTEEFKLEMNTLIANTALEKSWREEQWNKEKTSMLWKSNEAYSRQLGGNPNPQGKVTAREMGQNVLPTVLKILRKIQEKEEAFPRVYPFVR